MERFKYLIVSFLVLIFFLMEYTWIPWEDVPIFYTVPFVYDGGPVRLDSWIYNASVKFGHIIPCFICYILTPFKKESKLMVWAFTVAFVEFFFTWNEPISKIPLPFGMWVPISSTLLKLASICYFMWGAFKKALNQ
jgi:hypothetical protein